MGDWFGGICRVIAALLSRTKTIVVRVETAPCSRRPSIIVRMMKIACAVCLMFAIAAISIPFGNPPPRIILVAFALPIAAAIYQGIAIIISLFT
jgi:hypothetical protein